MPHDTDATHPPPHPRANGRSWPPPACTPPTAPPEPQGGTAEGDRWTVGRLLTWTTDYLKRRGSESPRLDTEGLLAKVLGWQRVQLYTHYEGEVGERPRADFRDLVRRRAEGTPVAYLVGRKEF